MQEDMLKDIEALKQSYSLLVKRVENIEKKLSEQGSRKIFSYPTGKITLYLDIDSILFKYDETLRPNAIDFLRWCMANFRCYLLTWINKGKFYSICKENNAEDIISGLNYVNLKEFRGLKDVIDIYEDFYCLTTKKHQYPQSLTQLRDRHYNDRIVKIYGVPIDEIKETIRDIMDFRITDKLRLLEAQFNEEFSLFKLTYTISTKRGRVFVFTPKNNRKVEFSIGYINTYDFVVKWSLRKLGRNDDEQLLLVTNTFEEFYTHLDRLPDMLREIDQQLSVTLT